MYIGQDQQALGFHIFFDVSIKSSKVVLLRMMTIFLNHRFIAASATHALLRFYVHWEKARVSDSDGQKRLPFKKNVHHHSPLFTIIYHAFTVIYHYFTIICRCMPVFTIILPLFAIIYHYLPYLKFDPAVKNDQKHIKKSSPAEAIWGRSGTAPAEIPTLFRDTRANPDGGRIRYSRLPSTHDLWKFKDPIDGGSLVPDVRPYFRRIFPYSLIYSRYFNLGSCKAAIDSLSVPYRA